MREILPSSSLGPGPDDLGQKGLTYSTYVTHKKTKPRTKKIFAVQT